MDMNGAPPYSIKVIQEIALESIFEKKKFQYLNISFFNIFKI